MVVSALIYILNGFMLLRGAVLSQGTWSTASAHSRGSSSDAMAETEDEVIEATEDAAPEAGSTEISKSKKKRQKKKAAAAAAGNGTADGGDVEAAAPPAAQVQPATDAQERYLSVLETLRSGDETAFWASLSGCGIGDKKAKKLAEALKQTVSQKVRRNDQSATPARGHAQSRTR